MDDPIAIRRPAPQGFRRARAARVAVLGLLVAVSAPLAAQEVGSIRAIDPVDEIDGPSVKLGETDLYPSLRVDALRVDNAYRTPDDERAASVVLVSPRVLWLARRRLLTLSGSYDGEYAKSGESVLEHADHRLQLSVEADANKRLRGDGSIVYRRGHFEPGANFSRGLGTALTEPVTFDQFELAANGRYGAVGARGNVGFGLRAIRRSYTNLDFLTAGRDYTFVEPYLRFSLRVAGDTRGFVELRAADVDFGTSLQDRQDVSLFGGVSFAPTTRTFGEFLVGVADSSYDDAARANDSTVVVEGTLRYQPREYSRLQLRLRRDLDNAAGVTLSSAVAAAVTSTVRLDWEYDWSERVSQRVFAGYESIERTCPDQSQQTTEGGLELALNVRRWLEVGGSLGAATRAGDGCAVEADGREDLDYDLVSYGIFVRGRL